MVKIFTLLAYIFLLHPVHVSMSSLSVEEDSRDWILTVRISNDDLVADLVKQYEVKEISFEDHLVKYTGPDEYLERYINDNLKISMNGKKIGSLLVSKDEGELETIFTLTVQAPKRVREVEIENTILTGLYSDQVNLFIFKTDHTERAIKFTGTKTRELIRIE